MNEKTKTCPICGKAYKGTITDNDGTVTAYVHKVDTANIWFLPYIQPEDICSVIARSATESGH
jgi:hypothetical protein